MKGGGFGLPGNIITGILGGIMCGAFFKQLAIVTGSVIGSIVAAATGAVALLLIVRFVKKDHNNNLRN